MPVKQLTGTDTISGSSMTVGQEALLEKAFRVAEEIRVEAEKEDRFFKCYATCKHRHSDLRRQLDDILTNNTKVRNAYWKKILLPMVQEQIERKGKK
jgi:hypothetical protein